MQFIYDKRFIIKYSLFAILMTGGCIFAAIMIPLFNIVALAFCLICAWFAVGSYIRVFNMVGKSIHVNEKGIHFYSGKKLQNTIHWQDVDDFSITNQGFRVKVGEQFHIIYKDLFDFHIFKNILAEELCMAKEKRGLELTEKLKDINRYLLMDLETKLEKERTRDMKRSIGRYIEEGEDEDM